MCRATTNFSSRQGNEKSSWGQKLTFVTNILVLCQSSQGSDLQSPGGIPGPWALVTASPDLLTFVT